MEQNAHSYTCHIFRTDAVNVFVLEKHNHFPRDPWHMRRSSSEFLLSDVHAQIAQEASDNESRVFVWIKNDQVEKIEPYLEF